MLWIISDTHFGHKKIAELSGRPDNWHNLLLHNWNSMIKEKDKVLHLGDFAFMTSLAEQRLVKSLNGYITLIRGNHDSRTKTYYSKLGIEVFDNPVVDDTHDLIFSHEPIKTNPTGLFNVHGHIHEKESEFKWGLNVSVERVNYRPITIYELLDLVKEKRDA